MATTTDTLPMMKHVARVLLAYTYQDDGLLTSKGFDTEKLRHILHTLGRGTIKDSVGKPFQVSPGKFTVNDVAPTEWVYHDITQVDFVELYTYFPTVFMDLINDGSIGAEAMLHYVKTQIPK